MLENASTHPKLEKSKPNRMNITGLTHMWLSIYWNFPSEFFVQKKLPTTSINKPEVKQIKIGQVIKSPEKLPFLNVTSEIDVSLVK